MRGTGVTVTRVPANAFKFNINSTNENPTMKADFSFKRLNIIENSFNFLKIYQNFLVFSKIFSKVIESLSNFSNIL